MKKDRTTSSLFKRLLLLSGLSFLPVDRPESKPNEITSFSDGQTGRRRIKRQTLLLLFRRIPHQEKFPNLDFGDRTRYALFILVGIVVEFAANRYFFSFA